MDEMYYQRYNINKLQNLKLARNTFDAEVNQGTDAGKLLAGAMNKHFGYKDEKSPGFFYKNISINKNLADAVNNLSEEDTIKVNDILTENRMEKYFRSVDKNLLKMLIILMVGIIELKAITVILKSLKNYIS